MVGPGRHLALLRHWVAVHCPDTMYWLTVIIVELDGYFVEFKTFTITVPVCPFNWIFLYVFHFQTNLRTLSNKPEVLN